jgi:CelD/BcsL family acetyltransferase involved in cellulose biosynthesis
VKLDIYNRAEVFEQLEPEWNELLHRSPADMIFSTWEWQSIWWRVYQPGKLWLVTCRDDDGRLMGIAPWFLNDSGTLYAIGCVDVTDYLDVIVDTENMNLVLDCLSACLAQHQDEFRTIELCNLPETSPTRRVFAELLKQRGFSVTVEQSEVCPVIDLPGSWDEYLSSLDKKQRHELRRKMRRANGATDRLDWYVVDSDNDLQEEIERFLKLMAASDPEKAVFLQDEQNVQFFKELVPVTQDRGWLHLNFLTVNDEAAAAYFNFTYNKHVLIYNSGLARDRYDHLSPGIVLLAYNIRNAIENGYAVFDFLRGDEPYKYQMGGKDTAVFTLTAHRGQ